MTEYRAIAFDNGEFPVVKIDRESPRQMEVIAIFYDHEDAKNCALNMEDAANFKAMADKHKAANGAATEACAPLTGKQAVILDVLRKTADGDGIAHLTAPQISEATGVARTSIFAILRALETKKLISGRSGGVYRIL